MRKPTNPNRPDKVSRAAMAENALRLRMAGLSFPAIGRQLKVSDRAASKMVARAMAALRERTLEAAEEYRDLEMARLDALTAAWWQRAMGTPNSPAEPEAARIVRDCIVLRMRLMGVGPGTKEDPAMNRGDVHFHLNIFEDRPKGGPVIDHELGALPGTGA